MVTYGDKGGGAMGALIAIESLYHQSTGPTGPKASIAVNFLIV